MHAGVLSFSPFPFFFLNGVESWPRGRGGHGVDCGVAIVIIAGNERNGSTFVSDEPKRSEQGRGHVCGGAR